MDKKVVVVTGGSRGIGKAISLTLAKKGYIVAFLYQGNATKAEETLEEVRGYSPLSSSFKCNVSDEEDVKSVRKEIEQKYGKDIFALVNNAGITRDALIPMMRSEDWKDVLDVNLSGTFYMIREFSRIFLKNKEGRIVNISSVSGVLGNPGQANYSASKAGIIGLTKTVAREFAKKGITANCVAPGFVETDMTKDLDRSTIENIIPLQRLAKPEDIADAVLFLIEAPYITGIVLPVDGGLAI